MKSIQQQERRQAQLLKRNIKRLIHDELHSISPWWLISFHYRDHHTKEDQHLDDVADLRRKLHRIIFQSRDKTIKGAGEYPYLRMLFFHETSHEGTSQFHAHLIVEKLPTSLNTQYEMEALFHKRLPQRSRYCLNGNRLIFNASTHRMMTTGVLAAAWESRPTCS